MSFPPKVARNSHIHDVYYTHGRQMGFGATAPTSKVIVARSPGQPGGKARKDGQPQSGPLRGIEVRPP